MCFVPSIFPDLLFLPRKRCSQNGYGDLHLKPIYPSDFSDAATDSLIGVAFSRENKLDAVWHTLHNDRIIF